LADNAARTSAPSSLIISLIGIGGLMAATAALVVKESAGIGPGPS